jgi:hypothetical protein
MDTNQWLDDIDIGDIIPVIVLGVAQSAKVEKTPRSTGLPGYKYLFEVRVVPNVYTMSYGCKELLFASFAIGWKLIFL